MQDDMDSDKALRTVLREHIIWRHKSDSVSFLPGSNTWSVIASKIDA